MGVLARILETAGIATVGLSLVRQQAENIKAPRFLHCEFPLGRPLGKPGDVDFQTDVIRRALALLERTDVPVLEVHPETFDDEGAEPAACTLPPRLDTSEHPAVDEARGLVPAYRRHIESVGGRTAFGRVATVDTIGDLVAKFVAIADGASLDDVGLDDDSVRAGGQDLRAFYEEAGLALADHVPAARQLEAWFFETTATGPIVKAASAALEAAGLDRNTWYYILPGSRR